MAARRQTLSRYWNYAALAINTFLLRLERPYLFILVINDMCNLNCFYCTSKNTGQYDLDLATVQQTLSAAHRRGHRALVITGGEPMLWESDGARLDTVVAYARELGFLDVAVFTNGTFPLSVSGCMYIVTVDGTRETHNAIRNGTYDTILAHAQQTRAHVIASITLSKKNETDIESAVKSITETGAFDGITFNLLTHVPEVLATDGLTGDQRNRVLDRLWSLKQQGFPIILSKSAYRALRTNIWKRPVKQIELAAAKQIFVCCRDVVNPDICRNCGYTSCVEISQALSGRLSAMFELLRVSR